MISYNPKDWIQFIFNFHKSDTVRKLLPIIIILALYSWFVAYMEMEVFKLSVNNQLKNLPIMHSLLGFAISMLLVFRTNTAYDRWWEGRRLWGSLVNSSRNLSIKLNSFLQDDNDRCLFKELIPHFAMALKLHLQSDITRLELDSLPHPEIPDFDTSKHVPVQIAGLMMNRVNQLYTNGKLTGDQLILLNADLSAFSPLTVTRTKSAPHLMMRIICSTVASVLLVSVSVID